MCVWSWLSQVLGGDGRYFNKEAAQIILKLAAGNGVKKMIVGKDALLCTPAASAVIRAQKVRAPAPHTTPSACCSELSLV